MLWQTMNWPGLKGILTRLSAIEAKETPACDHADIEHRLNVLEDHRDLHDRNIESAAADIRMLIDSAHDLENANARCKLAIDEGILKTNRAERRVRTAVSRARKELAALGLEDPSLEAEASELRETDDDGSEESGVRLLPAEVGEDLETPSTIKGVSVEQIKRARGL